MSERMNKERAIEVLENNIEYCEKVIESAVNRYTQLIGEYDNAAKIRELVNATKYAIGHLRAEELTKAFWVYYTTRKYDFYKCSNCGNVFINQYDEVLPNYCCECGFEMTEHKDNEKLKQQELEILKEYDNDTSRNQESN